MIDKVSIIMPLEKDRIALFMKTVGQYMEFGFTYPIEFLIITRTIDELSIPTVPIKLFKYEWEGEHFNPSMAFNIGIRNAQYENILITCPEVIPTTNVLEQLGTLVRGNYICQVHDQNGAGVTYMSLVNSNFRGKTPSMYFLACFKKEDLEAINGWDENFMQGYAWEDDDFGRRFVRAGLIHTVKDGIQGLHQFHKREAEGIGWSNNRERLDKNNREEVIRPKNGLEKIE